MSQEFPQVRRVVESIPGVLAARTAGFDAATQSIIARVDADAYVESGWAESIEGFFEETGDEFAAIVGPMSQYDMPFQGYTAFVQKWLMGVRHDETVERFRPTTNVAGSNMAITQEAWKAAREKEPQSRDLYEDVSLSLTLQSLGLKMAVVFGMKVSTSGRRLLSSARSYWSYTAGLPATYRAHGLTKQARVNWTTVWLARATWVAFYVPLRMFDPADCSWSVRRIFTRTEDREDPRR